MDVKNLLVRVAALALVISVAESANAVETSATIHIGNEVPLKASDLQYISAQVLAQKPDLASSKGVKFAQANRSARKTDEALVIFHPHSDTGGVKLAYQVDCSRPANGRQWTCDPAEYRQYLRVENQEHEVSVAGDITSTEALAAIEATRASLGQFANGHDAVCAALMVRPADNGFRIRWVCGGDDDLVILHASAIAGADITQTSGWRISEFLYPQY